MSRSEEIAKLSVGLELDSQSFSKKLNAVSKETRNLEKDFNVAKKAIKDSEDSMTSMEKALSKGEKAIESLNKKLEMQEERYDKLYKITEKQSNKYKDLQAELKQTEADLAKLTSEENKNEQAIANKQEEIDRITKSMNRYKELVQKNSLTLQSYSTDIDKTKNSLNKMQKEVKDISNELSKMKFNEATSDLKKFQDECKKLEDTLKKTSEKLEDMSDKTEKLSATSGAFAAVSGAAYLEADNALGKIRATLGQTTEEAQKTLDRVQDLANRGFDFNDALDSVISLEQALGDMLSTKEIDDLISELSSISKYFDIDIKDGIKTVSSMMKNFGITGQEATDIIAYGLQNGLNISDDFLDTLWEYSSQFADMGFTAEETLSIISSGMKDGAFNTDKLADGVKEFNLRLSEVGKTQEEALGTLGFNISEVTNALNEGGEAGKNMAVKVAMALTKVEDETERNRLSVALLGTQYEDVGDSLVNALAGVSDANLDVKGTADEVRQAFEDSLGARVQGKIQELKEPLIELAEKGLVPLIDGAIDLTEKFLEWFNTLDEGTIEAMAKFGMFAVVVSPLLKIFSNLASMGSGVASILGILGSKASETGGLVSGATSMFSKFSGILSALPGGPITAAIAGLVILASSLGDNEKAILKLQEKFGGLGTIIGGVCEFISGAAQITFGTVGNLIMLVADLIASILDGPGGQTMDDAWERFTSKQEILVQESMSKLSLATTAGLSQMRSLADEELNTLLISMDTIMSEIPNIVDGNYKEASNQLAIQLSNMSESQIMSLQALSDETRFLFDGIREGMSIDEIVPVLTSNFETMKTAGKLNIEDLEGAITSSMEMIESQMDSKTKEASNAVDSNLDQAEQAVKSSTKQMSSDASSGMDSVASSFMNSSGKIPKDVKSNMDQSVQSVRQAGTDMYNGVKTSFSKMEQVCKQHATDMYKGVQTSAEKMASSAKSYATDMYRGVTTSTSKMASQAIADWNRVRNAYSKPIKGTITMTTINKVESRTLVDKMEGIADLSNNNFVGPTEKIIQAKVPNIEEYDISNGYYNSNNRSTKRSTTSSSNGLIVNNNADTSKLEDLIFDVINLLYTQNNLIKNNNPVFKLEGREIARAIAPYSNEIDKYNTRNPKFLY